MMFRRWVGVGLGSMSGAATGVELALLLINSRLANLAQDSEGNLLVNNSAIYWSFLTLSGLSGLLLGTYIGVKLTAEKPRNKAPLKARVAENEAALAVLNSDPALSNYAPYLAADLETADTEAQEPFLFPEQATYSELIPISVSPQNEITSNELVLPVADFDEELSTENQAQVGFHLDINTNYFSSKRPTQGSPAVFFAAAPARVSPLSTEQIVAADSEDDDWICLAR